MVNKLSIPEWAIKRWKNSLSLPCSVIPLFCHPFVPSSLCCAIFLFCHHYILLCFDSVITMFCYAVIPSSLCSVILSIAKDLNRMNEKVYWTKQTVIVPASPVRKGLLNEANRDRACFPCSRMSPDRSEFFCLTGWEKKILPCSRRSPDRSENICLLGWEKIISFIPLQTIFCGNIVRLGCCTLHPPKNYLAQKGLENESFVN